MTIEMGRWVQNSPRRIEMARMVGLVGTAPFISSVSTPRDASALTITATNLSASGNTVLLTDNSGDERSISIDTESTTQIVTDPLPGHTFYLNKDYTLQVHDAAGVVSNAVVIRVLPQVG